MKWLHQLLLNMLATKDLYNKVFNYIDTWDETLASIALAIRASYHRTNMVTSLQTDFGRYMIINHASVVTLQDTTAAKQQQVDIDKFRENSR